MNQFNLVNEMYLLSNLRSKKLSKDKYTRWAQRIVLWTVYGLIIRYLIIGFYYKDTLFVMNWLSAGLIIQTITTYYLMGYVVLPRYVYKLNVVLLIGSLFVWHALIYETNYILFGYLQQLNQGERIERDWMLLKEAGPLGFMTDGVTAFWSFFYSLPLGLLFLIIIIVKDILNYKLKNLQLEKDKLGLELDFLKSQINPHFLLNTLNSVYADVFETNEKAADLILRMSELMRYNLYEADTPYISLDKELSYVQNYLDLECNRLSDQPVLIDYQQSGNPAAYQIVPLLLIAFVENAFKHGVKGAMQPAYVQVRATVTEGQLEFGVENSVPPKRVVATSVAEPTSGGIGLSNVRRRLEALYNGRYELVVTPTGDTYTIMLRVQVEILSRLINTNE